MRAISNNVYFDEYNNTYHKTIKMLKVVLMKKTLNLK